MLFFELSSFAGERTVLVESAKLVLEVVGSGRVVVLQRGPAGGGVALDSIVVEEEDGEVEVEMEVMLVILVLLLNRVSLPQVRHAVQGWILDPRLNFGLEVEGEVEVGRASLQINSKVNNEHSIYLKKKHIRGEQTMSCYQV